MKNSSCKMWSKRLALCLVCVIALSGCREKVQNAPNRYNYQRALEAFENNEMEQALEFCEKDLEENPNDARTLSMLAAIYHIDNHNEDALKIADKAIKYWSGKAGNNVVNPYYLRANIMLELEDTIKALADFDKALRVSDDSNKYKIIEAQMEIYYSLNDFKKLKKLAEKTLNEDPSHVMSYFNLSLIAIEEKKWDEALEYAKKIEKLDNDKASYAQYLRVLTSKNIGDYEVTANNIVELLKSESGNNTGFSMMLQMADSTNMFDAMRDRLEIQVENEPNESYWYYCLGTLYEQNNSFLTAIKNYTRSVELDADALTYKRIALCYSCLGDYKNALKFTDNALMVDSTAPHVMRLRSELLMLENRPQESIKCANELVAADPLQYESYENRADLYQYTGNIEEAIKDYGKSISLYPEGSYARIQRGKLLLKQGQKSKAITDFRKVLKTDSIPDVSSYAHFAYFFLNDYKNAKKHMKQIMCSDNTAGTYYDAACLYSLLNDSAVSIKFLRLALEKGYRDFIHIAMDADLDNMRNLKSFKSLMKEYIQRGSEIEISPDKKEKVNIVTSDIPFTREGGVCKVACKINGLPLHFIFDTGASDVTLSMVEATFMMKNGYLSKKDVVGSQHYMDANGNVSVGTVICLKKVNFGDLELNNIRASVVKNQKAPLLLGQSVLGRLGKIEINNSKRVLKITHKK